MFLFAKYVHFEINLKTYFPDIYISFIYVFSILNMHLRSEKNDNNEIYEFRETYFRFTDFTNIIIFFFQYIIFEDIFFPNIMMHSSAKTISKYIWFLFTKHTPKNIFEIHLEIYLRLTICLDLQPFLVRKPENIIR